MDHDYNVVAVAALALTDEVRLAVEQAAGRRGGTAAALTGLEALGDECPIEELAAGLRLSHSRTVRIVDALVADGLARRRADPADGRRVLVRLTTAGRRLSRRMLEARDQALGHALAALNEEQRSALAEIAEVLLANMVRSVDDAFFRCRYCDPGACGHEEGRCPVTRKVRSMTDIGGGSE